MDEVYTCFCGGQAFTIKRDKVTCATCGLVYHLPRFLTPTAFNNMRDTLVDKPNILKDTDKPKRYRATD